MEQNEKPRKIIDGDIVGFMVGMGLVFIAGNYAKDNFIDGKYIAASADSVATIFAATGAGVAFHRLLHKGDSPQE